MKTGDWLRRQITMARQMKLSAMQIIALMFLLIILLGTLLLALPCASRSGLSCGFLPALFTATSATCVTGLSFFDTWSQWSGFGQMVILCMIELGGLGFMSAASLVIFVFRKRVGLKQRMVMAQALSQTDMDGIVRLQKTVLTGSLVIQLMGAVILALRLGPSFGWRRGIRWGIFHSISAFCNAGFDIFGALEPGTSLMLFQDDPVVLLTISILIILGGLGFFVWQELTEKRRWNKLSVYTKLVLLTTLALLLGGWIVFCILEWNNPATLGGMNVGQKLLNGFFQSVTTRTAGFASIDQAGMTEGGKAVTIVLMLIGGSSGSTAGGIKTVTLVTLLLFVWAQLRGRSQVNVFHRRIPQRQVLDAMTLVMLMLGLSIFGGIFISAVCPVSFVDALYEAASALATVGLTAGVTTALTLPAQILIIIYMYFGRVGILTLSLGFLMGDKAEERFHYAHTNLLIG